MEPALDDDAPPPSLGTLPPELLSRLVDFLPAAAACRLGSACRALHPAAVDARERRLRELAAQLDALLRTRRPLDAECAALQGRAAALHAAAVAGATTPQEFQVALAELAPRRDAVRLRIEEHGRREAELRAQLQRVLAGRTGCVAGPEPE
ncbi:hypothetical protein DFJ74DRAFT_708993 [Hyaloraphidium curvatum]|nr:hypothetical protein DFJ74DRAFT_708993 [Hyaloraphidium curvatum]